MEQNKQWRNENIDNLRKRYAERYHKNREKNKEMMKKRYRDNPLPNIERARRWYEKNREVVSINNKERILKKIENGFCKSCPTKVFVKSKYCETHFFQGKARDILKDKTRWKEVRDLFYSQNQMCYMSGRLLIPGVNASIDHIHPKSKHPELKNDINNLRWCDFDVNKAKQALSNEKFIKVCEDVVSYNKSKKDVTYKLEVTDEVLTETKVNQSA